MLWRAAAWKTHIPTHWAHCSLHFQLGISISASCKVGEDGSSDRVSATYVWDLYGVPGYCLFRNSGSEISRCKPGQSRHSLFGFQVDENKSIRILEKDSHEYSFFSFKSIIILKSNEWDKAVNTIPSLMLPLPLKQIHSVGSPEKTDQSQLGCTCLVGVAPDGLLRIQSKNLQLLSWHTPVSMQSLPFATLDLPGQDLGLQLCYWLLQGKAWQILAISGHPKGLYWAHTVETV